MTHYIAIFVELDVGEWRVVFPDVPGCEARGFSVEDAGYAAASALRQCIKENGIHEHPPMNMMEVQRSEDWLLRNNFDLSRAVISLIPLAVGQGSSRVQLKAGGRNSLNVADDGGAARCELTPPP